MKKYYLLRFLILLLLLSGRVLQAKNPVKTAVSPLPNAHTGTSKTVAIRVNGPVPPSRLYVKVNASGANTGLNWEDAFQDLQSALTYSNVGNLSEIWVAQGTYKPTPTTGPDSRTISFSMLPNVAIYGGFVGNETSLSERPAINPVTGQPSSSTLSGDIGTVGIDTDNSNTIVYNPSGLTAAAVLDGFVITGANGRSALYNNGDNGFCNPSIRNCAFVNNNATSIGGAVYNSANEGVCNPILTNCSFVNNSARRGGAIFAEGRGTGVSNYTLVTCSFTNNSASRSYGTGGAIYNVAVENQQTRVGGTCSPTMTGCTFDNNSAVEDGGAIYNDALAGQPDQLYFNTCSPVLTDCRFTNNTAGAGSGGAIYNDGTRCLSSPILTNCHFEGNVASYQGGAMVNDGVEKGNSSPTLRNCSFINNTVMDGTGGALANLGRYGGRSTPKLINCIFIGNSVADGEGGAMYNEGYGGSNQNVGICAPELINCSFSGNSASEGSGLFKNWTANPHITNSVFFGNGGSETIYDYTSSSVTLIENSLLEPTVTEYTDGGNNLMVTASPFVSATDLRLVPCSPAIDAGTNSATGLVGISTDLAGNSRFFNNGTIDMGAYEFQGSIAQVGITSSPVAGSVVCAGGTVTAAVSVTSSGGTPGYQWYRNGTTVVGQTTATLSLTNVQPGDAGSYSLVVTTACQSLTSTAFSLTVTAVPSVTVSATPSLTIASGSAVTLTASGADGYRWSSGETTAAISVSTAGPYSVTGTTSGCSSVTSVAVFGSTPVPTVTGSFDGFIYGADCATFRGWVWDRNKPNAVITIDILDGATVVATIPAGEFRQDLLNAGKGNGRHAFFWSIPDALKDGLPHSLSARVTGNPFLLKDAPKALICSPNTTPGGNKPPQPPTPTVLIAPLVAQVGVPFSGTLVAFTDPEGSSLTYNLTGLPAGLNLEMPNRIISGTPTESGTFVLIYQATDRPGASNSVSFQLTVNPAETMTVTGSFEGYLDKLDCGGIRGWVWDRNKPNTPLTVEFYTESSPGSITVLGSTLANIYRQDLKDANKGNGAHAYNFAAPAGLTNGTLVLARVLGSGYLLKGSPKVYQCAGARLSAEQKPALEVEVFGNPISDQLDLVVRGAESHPVWIQVTDVQGRTICEQHISRAGLVEHARLSVTGQSAGLLVVRVSMPGQVKTVKVLKTY